MKIEEKKFPLISGRTLIDRWIVDASFDEWIAYLFDRPACEFGAHWANSDDTMPWSLPIEVTAEYVARTFENPGVWVSRFSVPQIAAGLKFTWDAGLGDVFLAIKGEGVSSKLHLRILRSLIPLFEECFAELCEQGLSHLNECSENPVNGVCYMFWDVCPLYGQPENQSFRERDDQCLRVMESTLQIAHDACRESALHGLGHWHGAYPGRVESVIQQTLKTCRKSLRRELLEYASAASRGSVV